MGLITDETGTYVPRPDGTRDYGTMTSAEINGEKLYDFDSEKGILRISMSPEDLELLKERIGEIPETGKDLTLPTPYMLGESARFKGVRIIESMPEVKEGEYILSLGKTVFLDTPQKRSLLNRLFGRKN